MPGISFKAVVESPALKQQGLRSKSGGIFSLSVNIYGPLETAPQVGHSLSAESAFLQHPLFLDNGLKYFNPQMVPSGGGMDDLTHLVGLTEDDFKAKALSDEVERVLESLDYFADLGYDGHDPVAIVQPEAIAIQLQMPKDDIPSYSTGGILADAMGLGKTLTMISAIVSSSDQAKRNFARSGYEGTSDVSTWPSRGNSCRCDTHAYANPGAVEVGVFHGKSRPKKPQDTIDCDIVLTTYVTLAMDSHWIRNQTSDQFKAAASLSSVHRWCLTGTPIQNHIGDLVSLLRFLHLEPFSQSSVFRQHILEPLSRDTPDRAFRLKALLSSVCLRRSEKLLQLPDSRVEHVTVMLRPEERLVYDGILDKCASGLDNVASSRVKIKKYSILFTAIMKLRRLCNHGTFPVSRRGLASVFPAAPNADDEQDCDFYSGADEDSLELAITAGLCPQCGKDLSPVRRSVKATISHRSNGSLSETTPRSASPMVQLSSTSQSEGLRYSLSSKLQAVVDRVERAEYGSKSLVFSYWTATLDMIDEHLREKQTQYLRIDGKVAYSDRLRVLEQFTSSDVPVLLMSIQTGAVGLTLIAADYVHIVEPQWNPSVEEYTVKGSVKENIVNLQRKKRNLARFTLDGTADGSPDSLDNLKFVLDFD
ncbi:SNF2 family N-terminal domain-containing protein [Lasiosphaeria miniovina]|uniref:SNF2 family N-terminal domain-containing protein n=1 Tax=Lasiosphaeria miniovina TaxID=1954250 RepID=A0AA40E995_9PEZI|nr:SNF2 family N-terminal domain-containing protein [Lasiosphaeria miniovina]KAK0728766.1 SNF2 family N-terminal domain-containing protein [Lasiosphaeria miniovina]